MSIALRDIKGGAQAKANMLQVKRLTESSKLPFRGSEFSAGYDLYASEPAVVKSKNRALVPTGIAISVPPGTYGRIAPRSGLAVKHGIDIGAGVIDLAVFYALWNILQNCPNHASRLSMGLTWVPV